ncbi:hypothetical protein ACFFGR_16815 [Arthrobacter liuii]|uniref:hypothetical protein n=1 Tax=Arthrobacter liuii TaxID=1476996 RepID=UPI001663FB77|nr:hypothetical protein [Arthrobacter liuii]
MSATVTLLVSAGVAAAVISAVQSAQPAPVAAVTTTATASVPGPTVTVPGPERTVTVASPAETVIAPDPATAVALQTCRTAVTAGGKALKEAIDDSSIEQNAILNEIRTGDSSALYAADARLKQVGPGEVADIQAFAAARDACLSGR